MAPVVSLNQATAYESPAHSSTGTRLESWAGILPLLGSLRTPPLRLAARRLYSSPTTPFSRFKLLPFRSPLLWESLLVSFPLATKMFQLARLSLACLWIQQQFERLTYSEISRSTLIFNSQKNFVSYYALPRLWVPRYPP
ncbi:hypothetical protein HN51_003262 [Arachis hypogaea]